MIHPPTQPIHLPIVFAARYAKVTAPQQHTRISGNNETDEDGYYLPLTWVTIYRD